AAVRTRARTAQGHSAGFGPGRLGGLLRRRAGGGHRPARRAAGACGAVPVRARRRGDRQRQPPRRQRRADAAWRRGAGHGHPRAAHRGARLAARGGGASGPGAGNASLARSAGRAVPAGRRRAPGRAPRAVPAGPAARRHQPDPRRPARRAGGAAAGAADPRLRRGQGRGARPPRAGREHLRRRTERVRLVRFTRRRRAGRAGDAPGLRRRRFRRARLRHPGRCAGGAGAEGAGVRAAARTGDLRDRRRALSRRRSQPRPRRARRGPAAHASIQPRQRFAGTAMQFISTRGQIGPTPIDDALVAWLAPDGGLYVPERIPAIDFSAPAASLPATALRTLAPYFVDSSLRGHLQAICADAFSFDAPLRPLAGAGDHVLELFHGPTAAFKDYAARFLARALEGLRSPDAAPTTILVATSGDTGAAVAAAVPRRPG